MSAVSPGTKVRFVDHFDLPSWLRAEVGATGVAVDRAVVPNVDVLEEKSLVPKSPDNIWIKVDADPERPWMAAYRLAPARDFEAVA